jgi:hypothetical protein
VDGSFAVTWSLACLILTTMSSKGSGAKRAPSAPLKQSTLAFHALKRSNTSTSTDKKTTARPARSPVKQRAITVRDSDDSSEESDRGVDDIEISSSEDEDEIDEIESSEEKNEREVITFDTPAASESDGEGAKVDVKSLLAAAKTKEKEKESAIQDLNPNDPRWRPLYKVAVKEMGTNKPSEQTRYTFSFASADALLSSC